ncbi:unnamed protein product [Orchesella dallaii]|uniref:BTB domain-containing protein n=1 Tax=Orchesella dallaii TaxID=48710 RepID=A0ABP1RBB6_9HEXA
MAVPWCLLTNDGGNETDSADIVVKATAQFCLLNADEHTVRTFRLSGTSGFNVPLEFIKGRNMFGTGKFIMSSYIMNPSNNIVVDNVLKIQCEIHIIGETNRKVLKAGSAKCCTELEKLFTDSICTDLTIVVGKSSFQAHKAVLMGNFLQRLI